MKFAKIFFASFILLAIASAFVTPKKHVKHAAKHTKTQVCNDYELVWNGGHLGGDFTLGSTTPTSELDNAGNYASSFQAWGTLTTCSGDAKPCKIRITYCYDNAQQSDPLPNNSTSIQSVIDQVFNNYNASGGIGHYFPVVGGVYQFTFTVGSPSVTVTIQVITKA
jgi:hypothetical protein